MRVVIKLLIVFSCIFSSAIFSAQSASFETEWGQLGRVNMQGAIIDTACSIAIDSREQTVDMGVVPVSDIILEGRGHSKPFSIQLVNCLPGRAGITSQESFQVTFDGDAEGDLFSVRGEASGVALQIVDRLGNVVLPGKALPFADIMPDSMNLNYTLKLVENNHTLNAGSYFSSIRFKLDYF